jgi:hypothetical protein
MSTNNRTFEMKSRSQALEIQNLKRSGWGIRNGEVKKERHSCRFSFFRGKLNNSFSLNNGKLQLHKLSKDFVALAFV